MAYLGPRTPMSRYLTMHGRCRLVWRLRRRCSSASPKTSTTALGPRLFQVRKRTCCPSSVASFYLPLLSSPISLSLLTGSPLSSWPCRPCHIPVADLERVSGHGRVTLGVEVRENMMHPPTPLSLLLSPRRTIRLRTHLHPSCSRLRSRSSSDPEESKLSIDPVMPW